MYDNFNEILGLLEQCPGLPGAIGMEKAMVFVRLATRLKDEIISKQKPGQDPSQLPDMLPPNVSDFLGHTVQIPDEYVSGCWHAFRQTVWQRDVNGDSVGADAKLFKEYGLQNLLCKWFIFYGESEFTAVIKATRTLFPPMRECTNFNCTKQGSPLRRKDDPRRVVLFTLGEGACPTYSTHLHCHGNVPHKVPSCPSGSNMPHNCLQGAIPTTIMTTQSKMMYAPIMRVFPM